MNIINNLKSIKNNLISLKSATTIIVVCKNQEIAKIKDLVNYGHLDFGENKVQEGEKKWQEILNLHKNINLHFIGKLQSNKAKQAFQLFNYIHSLDSEKLAKCFSDLEISYKKKIKYFIQVNIGDEEQKNGISEEKLKQFINLCVHYLKLNVIGLMCIPPAKGDPSVYFKRLAELAKENNLNELSMGMSNDYESAINNGATFIRIGSKIFS
jgi:pyridoxal phosphate enzyme (YggS family)